MKAPALLTIAAAVGLLGMRAPALANPNTDLSVPRFPPLVLYTARGTDGCGDGCDEWIAAEGGFDIGSAQRLRVFLSQFSGPHPADLLPVPGRYSGGGDRHRPLDARARRDRRGRADTAVWLCARQGRRGSMPRNQAFRSAAHGRAAQHRLKLQLRLRLCASRRAGPAGTAGRPAGRARKPARARISGRAGDPAAWRRSNATCEATNELKRYVQEMGIDVALIDTAFKTKFSDAYFLTRNEIVQFGIDTRTFQETRWIVLDAASRRPFGVQARG